MCDHHNLGDEVDDDGDGDDDDGDVDDDGHNEGQSVLWESGCILKVSWQYLYYWPRYRGYRGGGGKHFDDVDEDGEDNDDVDHEGQNEGESVLWESERILKVSCQYLQELLRYREYRGRGGKYFDDDDEDDDDDGDDDDDDDFDPRNGDHESQRGLFYI